MILQMMADQDRNVKQWWVDRNNIINSQKTRNAGLRSLNEVLYVCLLRANVRHVLIVGIGKASEASLKPRV